MVRIFTFSTVDPSEAVRTRTCDAALVTRAGTSIQTGIVKSAWIVLTEVTGVAWGTVTLKAPLQVDACSPIPT